MDKINEIIKVKVAEEHEGERIDKVLSLLLPKFSRSYLQKILEEGYVYIDGVTCKQKRFQLKSGSNITVQIPEARELAVEPENIPLQVVYEDEYLLVIEKPKGMVVHPGAGNWNGTLVNAVLHHCGASLSSINGIKRPGIVHRIDKDTSGLLMVAKNDIAHKALATQLAEHSITRRYQCIVYNNFKENFGTINAPIGRDPNMRLRMAVLGEGGKRAVTHYDVLQRFGKYTLVEARLETGRTHQIRVHMAHIGHPLLGDEIYGPSKNQFSVSGQMLHACILGFKHPKTGEYMEFTSPLPEEFEKLIKKLSIK